MDEFNYLEHFNIDSMGAQHENDQPITIEQVKAILIAEYRIAKAELLYEEQEAHSYFDWQLIAEKKFFIEKLMRKLNIDYEKETT